MKRSVFVIEDDPKFMGEIKEALEQISPDLNIREFKDLNAFVTWLRTTLNKFKKKTSLASTETETTDETASINAGEDASKSPSSTGPVLAEGDEEIQIDLLVCRLELLKQKSFVLLQGTRDYFLHHKLCLKEQPTAFVLTAFETEDFDYSRYENQVVSNIIFKPFDKLILREHLRIALAGAAGDSSGEIYKQKTKSKVEMLKDVTLKSLSEIGFTTVSDREVPLGTQAKYYSHYFQGGTISSIHAKALANVPIKERPGYFTSSFTYTNIQNAQISSLRKIIKGNKKHITEVIKVTKALPQHVYSFITIAGSDGDSIKSNLEGSFSNTKCVEYNELITFMMDLDPGSKTLGEGSKGKEKFLPFPAIGKLFYDLKINKIVTIEPAVTETATLLGIPVTKVLETESFLHQKIHNEDRNRWIALCKTHLKTGAPPEVFRFKSTDDRLAFIKVISLQSFKHEKLGEVMALELVECSESEKLAYLQKLSRLPKIVDAIFVESAFISEMYMERWGPIVTVLNEHNKKSNGPSVKLFFLSNKVFDSDTALERTAPIEDVFSRPLDASYFKKKIRTIFEKLLLKDEDLEISTIEETSILKVAQPVVAEEVGETGLSLVYHRAIPVGSFRKVCLWLPHEIGLPEFLASCSSVEEMEKEDKTKAYLCHFIFFGVRDTSLKHIRRWIKDYYVAAKEKEGG